MRPSQKILEVHQAHVDSWQTPTHSAHAGDPEMVRLAVDLADRVRAAPGRFSPSTLKKNLSRRWQYLYDDAITYARVKSWIRLDVTTIPAGRGSTKRTRYNPGTRRPRIPETWS